MVKKGYKQTEIGVIPEDWAIKYLSDFGKVQGGGTPSTTMADYWGGDIAWCTPSDITSTPTPDGKHTKRPTKIGEENGISVEERTSSNRPYQVVVYNNAAQHFIIDNLDAILTTENMQTQMQGTPWTKEHDDCLIDLYKKSVPVSEIAITLKRSASAVRGRLKYFIRIKCRRMKFNRIYQLVLKKPKIINHVGNFFVTFFIR